MDRSSRQTNSKDMLDLNYMLDQINLTDMYRTFYTATAKYTFFSSEHGIFSSFYHKLDLKTSQ